MHPQPAILTKCSPAPDGFLAYEIIPTPAGVVIEKDVMVTMPDGIKLACNVYRPGNPENYR